jgi:hypothetical protein
MSGDPGQAALRWMREHPDRLRALVDAETGPGDDPSPAGDPAVRAALRLAAEALAATARPGPAARLAGLGDDLPGWFAAHRDLYEHHLALGAGAVALEEHLQFGTRPGTDPSLDAALGRRVRVSGWVRLFVLAVEDRLGAAHDGLAAAVLDDIRGRGRELAGLIVAMDRSGRQAAAARRGRPITDLATLDEIGQAAAVQAGVRIAVEAVAAALGAPDGPE